MSDLDQTLTRTLAMTQGCAIQALFATHPNPDLLRTVFAKNAHQLVQEMKASGVSQSSWGAIQMHADKLLDALP